MKTCGKSIKKPGQRDFCACGYGYQCINCQLSDFTGESQKEAEVKADPNEVEVDQILARLESYYKGDERLARGAKHLSVNTEDLRTLTDYIKFMRGQLRAANRRG